MELKIFRSAEEIHAAVGSELGVSDWLTVRQTRIDSFADATDDHQWIHVNPERATKDSPYATTIAHGYLVLSLLPRLYNSVVAFEGFGTRVNYGLNRVRFPAPVFSGASIRDRVKLADVTLAGKWLRLVFDHTVELADGPKPACVAQTIVQLEP